VTPMPGSLPEPQKPAVLDTQAEPPDTGKSFKAAPASRRWRTIVEPLLTFCLGIVVALGVVLWLAGPSPSQPGDGTETVARAWNRTINELDIEPLFPPQEDIYVGDVFVVVTDGEPTDIGRMVKIWHVDMSEDLEQAYKGMPFFEQVVNAQAAAPSATQVSGAPAQGNTLFRSSAPPRDLSLVAFPGFTTRHARSAQSGLQDGGGLLGFIGVGRDNQETVEFQLTSSATYGVPSLMATNQLAKLCTEDFTKRMCLPEVARRELSMVVGRRAREKDEKGAYVLDVELILVSRVYLTRSIAQRRSANSVFGMQAKMAAQLQALAQQSALLAQVSNATQPGTGASESTANALHTAQEAMQKQLLAVSRDLSEGLPGGIVSYAALDASTIELEQKFDRPLVIGYRAVRTVLPYPEPDQ
jgi:hypothetical protein